LTVVAVVLGLYLVVLPCLAWLEAAYYQAQGGRAFAGAVVFDVLMALVTPVVFALVGWEQRRNSASIGQELRRACGCAALVGVPVLFLRFPVI
jgi:hypothetical protein